MESIIWVYVNVAPYRRVSKRKGASLWLTIGADTNVKSGVISVAGEEGANTLDMIKTPDGTNIDTHVTEHDAA